MEEDQKFYITPNRILDTGAIRDVVYKPAGSPTGTRRIKVDAEGSPGGEPELREESELVIVFKGAQRDLLTLYGHEADTAWKNFQARYGSNG
jgi:hypothetical protein